MHENRCSERSGAMRSLGDMLAREVASNPDLRPSSYPPCSVWATDVPALLLRQSRIVPTGIAPLDMAFGGGLGDELLVVAAPPGYGKSDLAVNLAVNFLAQGETVFYLSVELSRTQILMRALSCLSSRSGAAEGLATAELMRLAAHDNCGRLAMLLERLGSFSERFYIIDDGYNDDCPLPPHTIPGIRDEIHRFRAFSGAAPILIVDYLQQMPSEGESFNPTSELDRMSRLLASIAHNEETAVIALSSMSKKGEIRGSSHIEHDADKVLFLKLPAGAKEEAVFAQSPRPMIAALRKNRNGRTGIDVPISYHPEIHFITG